MPIYHPMPHALPPASCIDTRIAEIAVMAVIAVIALLRPLCYLGYYSRNSHYSYSGYYIICEFQMQSPEKQKKVVYLQIEKASAVPTALPQAIE